MSNNNDPDPIAPGNSYFLHVLLPSDDEVRYRREPADMPRSTHFVTVIAVDDEWIVEEATLTMFLKRPYGKGWEHVSGNTFRRRRAINK